MRNLTFFLAALIALAPAAYSRTLQAGEEARKHTVTGTLEITKDFESKILGNKRSIRVWLPPGYLFDRNTRYPVLYMNDGQNLFDGYTSYLPNREWRCDEAATGLIDSKLIEPIIIVGIDNGGAERGNEYLPWQVDLGKWGKTGGKADLYCRFVIEELMPFINAKYRTKTGAENTAICGSSFGGVISLYIGLTHPDVFSKLGVVSPSLWCKDGELVKMTKALPSKLPLQIWLDMGGAEGFGDVVLALRERDALESKGWTMGQDLTCYIDGYAIHQEGAWANRFPAMLMFWYGVKR